MAKKKKKKTTKLKDIPEQATQVVIESSGRNYKHWAIVMVAVFCVGILAPAIAHQFEIAAAVFGLFIISGYLLYNSYRNRNKNIGWSNK